MDLLLYKNWFVSKFLRFSFYWTSFFRDKISRFLFYFYIRFLIVYLLVKIFYLYKAKFYSFLKRHDVKNRVFSFINYLILVFFKNKRSFMNMYKHKLSWLPEIIFIFTIIIFYLILIITIIIVPILFISIFITSTIILLHKLNILIGLNYYYDNIYSKPNYFKFGPSISIHTYSCIYSMLTYSYTKIYTSYLYLIVFSKIIFFKVHINIILLLKSIPYFMYLLSFFKSTIDQIYNFIWFAYSPKEIILFFFLSAYMCILFLLRIRSFSLDEFNKLTKGKNIFENIKEFNNGFSNEIDIIYYVIFNIVVWLILPIFSFCIIHIIFLFLFNYTIALSSSIMYYTILFNNNLFIYTNSIIFYNNILFEVNLKYYFFTNYYFCYFNGDILDNSYLLTQFLKTKMFIQDILKLLVGDVFTNHYLVIFFYKIKIFLQNVIELGRLYCSAIFF